ncbi:MAG: diacylglycerol kinase family protein [Cyanobacteria bacterium P01_A01_bin.135]
MSQQLSTNQDLNNASLREEPELAEVERVAERAMSWQVATNLLVSFRYAWAGITYSFRTQRNFRIHTVLGSLAIALGLWVNLTRAELSVIALITGVVLAMELLNTAIESVVDLTVKQTYHELAKVAKDCAAAAVLVCALAALVIAGALLFPPLLLKVAEMLTVPPL